MPTQPHDPSSMPPASCLRSRQSSMAPTGSFRRPPLARTPSRGGGAGGRPASPDGGGEAGWRRGSGARLVLSRPNLSVPSPKSQSDLLDGSASPGMPATSHKSFMGLDRIREHHLQMQAQQRHAVTRARSLAIIAPKRVRASSAGTLKPAPPPPPPLDAGEGRGQSPTGSLTPAEDDCAPSTPLAGPHDAAAAAVGALAAAAATLVAAARSAAPCPLLEASDPFGCIGFQRTVSEGSFSSLSRSSHSSAAATPTLSPCSRWPAAWALREEEDEVPEDPQPMPRITISGDAAEPLVLAPSPQASRSFRRRFASAALFAVKVSSALDDEDLAVPWKETEKLTKLNSCLLRTGLKYSLAEGEPATSQPPAPTTAGGPSSLGGRLSLPGKVGKAEEDNPRVRHAVLQEIHRVQELQDRIERRDRRRECARQHAEDQQRREAQALRTAMWLTIATAVARNLAARLGLVLDARKLSQRILPAWRLFVHRNKQLRARQRLLARVAPQTARLTPAALRATGPLFQDWPEPLLEAFAGEMQLCPFPAEAYICHQGDPSSLLYVLVAGAVDVVLRRPDTAGKARGKRTGLTVAQLTPGRYVGEYGVFAGEPRAATLYCATPVVAWAASKECLVRFLRQVPVPVYCGICSTFESNMAKIYKVRPAQLANTLLFQGWDLPTLELVVDKMQPVFFPEDTIILDAGSSGTAVFMVAKGRCCTTRAGQTEELTAGALLGLRACVFLEGHPHEVRALTTVQAWRLPKAALIDFLLCRPDRFLAAKQRINAELARTLAKPPLEELFADSPLAQLPRPAQQQLYARLLPFVLGARDPVVQEGDPVDSLLFLTCGQCTAAWSPLPPAAHRCLGAEQVTHRVGRWPHGVTAQERVEGWRLPLADVLAVLEAQKGVPRHRAMKTLLADVATAQQRL